LDLLGTTDNRLAFHLARKLDATNRERQGVERRVLEEATERIGPQPPWAIVTGDRSWHPGVVGIVAGRLARKYHRPAIVFGWDGSSMKGSGRGIPGIDLLAVMDTCSFPPRQWGGHPAAMGLSLAEEDLEPFAESFAAAVKEACEGELPEKSLSIDAVADPVAIDRSCVLELEALGPFGQGNPEPVLAIRGAVLERPPAPMGRDHIRFELPANPSLRFIGWRMAANPPPTGTPVDLAVRPSRSFWRGRESLRAEVVDWRPAADDRGK
jgi:single-stranded-DNA-specific exonuclease